ncbi:amidase domain-containing protein [Clostridium sp. FP2]|nr:amidase domain-containing protein [Clostridium tagluense]MBZ9626056.1 amidase domain-containing protein [Clostridium sp. FP2]WLC68384.1 amidase domain-containing protein [Clostridium tagluense]
MYSINENAVKNYIDTNYNTFNSSYPNWTSSGGDCANFVSQCLDN